MTERLNTFWGSWQERLRALHNVPPLLKIVWESGPGVVGGGLCFRVLAALVPISVLAVSKLILDAVQAKFSGHPLPAPFWFWVAAEFGLAALGGILARTVSYFDVLLADRFTRHVSLLVMEHASRLDLASYEDPLFYDKLERARVQATDRIAMIQAMGAVGQQLVVAVTFRPVSSGSLRGCWSCWWLPLCRHSWAKATSLFSATRNIRQTPVKRQLDYLRVLGASKESAKELKLFGLSGFPVGRICAAVEPRFTTRMCDWRAGGCGPGRCFRCSAPPATMARTPM